MLTRIDGDTVNHSWLIVFNYHKLTQVINNEKNVDGGWLEGWGREALDNLVRLEKCVGLIIHRTLFLIGFEVRWSQLLLKHHLNRLAARTQLHGHQISNTAQDSNEHWLNLTFPVSATLLCFYLYPETLTRLYMFYPPPPVFPCQQPARRGDSQLWLRQNEYTCGMFLVWLGQLQI